MAGRRDDEEDDILIEDEDRPTNKGTRSNADGEDENPKAKGKARSYEDEDDERPTGKGGRRVASEDEDDGPGGATDVDWGDAEKMRPKGQLDRIEVAKGEFARFSILPFVKPKKAEAHYIQGKGYALCNSTPEHKAICCKRLGDPSERIALLIVQYTSANRRDGKLDPEKELTWEIRSLTVSPTAFRDLARLPDEDMSPHDMDIAMTTRDNGKGYTYRRMKTKATWKLNKDLMRDVEEECEKFRDGKTLTKKLGNRKTAAEMRAWVGEASGDDDEVIKGL